MQKHEWREYMGLVEKFIYCENCDEKQDEVGDSWCSHETQPEPGFTEGRSGTLHFSELGLVNWASTPESVQPTLQKEEYLEVGLPGGMKTRYATQTIKNHGYTLYTYVNSDRIRIDFSYDSSFDIWRVVTLSGDGGQILNTEMVEAFLA